MYLPVDFFLRVCYDNKGVRAQPEFAGVAELADAPDLGSGVPDVQVQVLSPAPIFDMGH